MTRSQFYLGFDVGTQGTKGLVIDAAARRVVARASSAYGLIEGLPPGHAEQHPSTWERALREVTASLAREADLSRLAGLGVSGQQHGCVVLDDAGEVVRPAKLWCDTSTASEAEVLSRAFGHAVPAGFTASKVLWLIRREPESWSRAEFVMLPHDWVNFRLTGLATAEPGDASGTGWLDVRERRWSARSMSAIDPALARKVPPLIESGEVAGELTEAGAKWLGLPRETVGALVATGGGDNMMSAIGSGATREGVAVLSLGTSATVFGHSRRPVVDPRGAIAAFCDSTGGWLPLLCVMNATGVLEEVRGAFGAGLETLTAEAERVEPGCGGATFVPYLMGERVPDLPRASGTLHGLRPGSLARGVLFRAALEGVALNLALGVERLRELGLAVDSVRAVGGGARNPLWRSILADCFRASVTPLAEPESAALGAALQAHWTAERARGSRPSIDELVQPWIAPGGPTVEPDTRRAARYAEARARFAELVQRLHGPAG
jgi:D-xylulose kinase